MEQLLTVRLRAAKGNPILGFIKTEKLRNATPHEEHDLGVTEVPVPDHDRIGRSLVEVLEDNPGASLVISEIRDGDAAEYDRQVQKAREDAEEKEDAEREVGKEGIDLLLKTARFVGKISPSTRDKLKKSGKFGPLGGDWK